MKTYYINSEGRLYEGDLQPGDREATAEEVAAWFARVAVPQQVDMRQAQLAMLEFTYPDGSNLLDKVNALIAQQSRAAQVTWNTSGAVQRSNPLIAALQPALGLTDAQIDQLFVTADSL